MIYLDDGDVRLHHGDVRAVLAELPERSVDCVVTSPPYWQLRDYGYSDQIGLEPTIEEYLAALVGVFREVRRVLAPWGTCWLNVGDSYTSTAQGTINAPRDIVGKGGREGAAGNARAVARPFTGLKPKDLCMVPARVALALQADGWWLRSRVVWHKPNPMPESVTDRPTSAYEEIILLTKAPTYYYDAEAVREAVSPTTLADRRYEHRHELNAAKRKRDVGGRSDGFTRPYAVAGDPSGRNLRNVWTIATEPTPEAHFATFPLELVRRCLAAGCPERVCRECGEPSRRVVGKGDLDLARPQARRAVELAEAHGLSDEHLAAIVSCGVSDAGKAQVTQDGFGKNGAGVQALADEAKAALGGYYREFLLASRTTTGWTDCGHDAWRPGIVLDPFVGSGKTAQQARRMGLHAVGIDGSAEYLAIAAKRLRQLSLFSEG